MIAEIGTAIRDMKSSSEAANRLIPGANRELTK